MEVREDWQPVSKPALTAWLVFYGLFLLHALTDDDGFLIIDRVNLIVHEAGHLLFGLSPERSGEAGRYRSQGSGRNEEKTHHECLRMTHQRR